MRTAAIALVSVLLVAVWFRPSPKTAPRKAMAAGQESQFRVIVGLTDASPGTWQGSIKVSGGEITSLRGWRFSSDDRAEANGNFSFATRIGMLEDQRLTGQPYGQTAWNDPKAKRVIPEGLRCAFAAEAACRSRPRKALSISQAIFRSERP